MAPEIYANSEADVFWPVKMLEDPSTIPLAEADLHNDILNLLSRKDSKRIRRLLISPEEQFLIPSIILKCLTALEELNLTTQQAGCLDQWMNYKELELITKKKIEYEKDDGEWEDLFGEHQRHNRRGDRVHDIESFLKLKAALIRSSGVTFNFGWLQGIGSVPQPSVPAVSKTTRDAKRASKNFSRIRTGRTQCRYITYTEPGMWCWTCMAYSDVEYQPYPHHHVQSATKQPPSAPDSLDSGRANQLNPVSETSWIYKPTTLLHLSPWDAYRNFMNQFAPHSEAGIVGIVESDSQLIPAKRAKLECALHRFHAYRELLEACCPCFRCGRTRGEAVEARWAREAQDAEEAQKIALEERNLGNSGGEATIDSPYHGDGAFREDFQGPVSPQYRQHDDGRYCPDYRHGDYEDYRRSVSPQDRYPQHRHRSDHHRGNYEDGRRSVFPQEKRVDTAKIDIVPITTAETTKTRDDQPPLLPATIASTPPTATVLPTALRVEDDTSPVLARKTTFLVIMMKVTNARDVLPPQTPLDVIIKEVWVAASNLYTVDVKLRETLSRELELKPTSVILKTCSL